MTADPEMAAAERAVIEVACFRLSMKKAYDAANQDYATGGANLEEFKAILQRWQSAQACEDAAVAALIALRAARGMP